MQSQIPLLNAKWNDVLHFSVLNPEKTFAALTELRGISGISRKIVRIPADVLNERKCVYFFPSDKPRSNYAETLPEEVAPFIAKEYVEQNDVSAEQIAKWRENIEKNEPVLIFNKTTHLLYKGELDISGFTTVVVES